MSSSMETVLLLSDAEPGPKHWRDVDRQKWQEKSRGCFAKTFGGMCFITGKDCDYAACFGRYWGTM